MYLCGFSAGRHLVRATVLIDVIRNCCRHSNAANKVSRASPADWEDHGTLAQVHVQHKKIIQHIHVYVQFPQLTRQIFQPATEFQKVTLPGYISDITAWTENCIIRHTYKDFHR